MTSQDTSSPETVTPPKPAQAAGDYVLVPRDPTKAMLNAARKNVAIVTPDGTWPLGRDEAERTYGAMLAASPALQPQPADAPGVPGQGWISISSDGFLRATGIGRVADIWREQGLAVFEMPATITADLLSRITTRAPDVPGAVAVKALEWAKHPTADMWRAETQLGLYQVSSMVFPAAWTLDGTVLSTGAICANGTADTAEAAKAAAQADYERRILSAITPNPVPAGDDGALREAEAEVTRLRAELMKALCTKPDTHPVLLDREIAEVTLWQAIRNIKIGNRDDDKLIVRELAELGFAIATIPTDAALAPVACPQCDFGIGGHEPGCAALAAQSSASQEPVADEPDAFGATGREAGWNAGFSAGYNEAFSIYGDARATPTDAQEAASQEPVDHLPRGHVVLEGADRLDGRVSQTVQITATGEEYERVVHASEAYGDAE